MVLAISTVGSTAGSGARAVIDRPAEPYDSADRGVMARQISQAQSAGIDGFVMSWFGPGEPYTSSVFGGLLDQAASQGFKVAVDIDMGQGFLSSVDEARNAVSHAIHSYGNHPGYLRYDGKPVISFWKQQRFSPQQWAGSATRWTRTAIRSGSRRATRWATSACSTA